MSSIVDITLKDIEKRRIPSKHYAFIIEVSWSDGRSLKIGRTYSDFFDFQMNLLEKFPSEAGQGDPTKRIIPFLPGKSLFRRSNTREYTLKRMGPISEYCTGIAKMPRHLLENGIVEDFFRQNNDDTLHTSKSPAQEDVVGNALKANEITGPLVLDKYVVIADYKKENKKELNLKSGQVLEVIEKSEFGWWLAANEEGMNGWVPSTYLEALYGETSSPTENRRVMPGEGEMFEAVADFSTSEVDELPFQAGDILEILEKNLDGWWYGRNNREGWVPAAYLQKSSEPTPKTTSRQTDVPQISIDQFNRRVSLHQAVVKPPPKRSTVRRTLTKDAALRVQQDFRTKYLSAWQAGIPEENEEEDMELNETYVTVDKFDSTIPDGLSFRTNETVHVIRKSSAGWWYGRIGDKRGWVPESYLSIQSPLQVPNITQKPPVPTPISIKNVQLNLKQTTRPLPNEVNSYSTPVLKSSKPPRPPGPSKLPGIVNKTTNAPMMIPPLNVAAPASPVPTTHLSMQTRTSLNNNLDDYEWYRDISRHEAEEALLCEGQEGYFIVRPSARGAKKGKPYSLTLYHQKNNWNFHIRMRHDGKYAVGLYKESEACFGTLPDLISYYEKIPLIIGEEERKVLLTGTPSELYAAC